MLFDNDSPTLPDPLIGPLTKERDEAIAPLATMGMYVKNVEAGRDAIQKRENENLQEMRALRRLESHTRKLLPLCQVPSNIPETWNVMDSLSLLNALRVRHVEK